MERIKWYFKQLFPLVYFSEFYSETEEKKMVAVWKMWLGKCYQVRFYEIV